MAYRLSKTERIARGRLLQHLWEARADALEENLAAEVPEAWHTLEADLDVVERKVKVTLYLDASVARVFRAMGVGYQARINRILATWVQMKIAGLMRERAEIERRFSWLMARDAAALEEGQEPPGFG
jgi:uncharacterized protein (DUF4415 family)